MSALDPADAALLDEFHLQYGKTLGQWADLEHVLSWWFHRLTRAADAAAGTNSALFYSGRSFQTRRDLLQAALDHHSPEFRAPGLKEPLDADTLTFLREAFRLAFNYSNSRNRIAHRLVMFESNSKTITLQEGDSWWSKDGHTLADLRSMETNYRALKDALVTVLIPAMAEQPMTPQEALVRVRTMPREAHSNQPNPMRAKRQKPPQPSRT